MMVLAWIGAGALAVIAVVWCAGVAVLCALSRRHGLAEADDPLGHRVQIALSIAFWPAVLAWCGVLTVGQLARRRFWGIW